MSTRRKPQIVFSVSTEARTFSLWELTDGVVSFRSVIDRAVASAFSPNQERPPALYLDKIALRSPSSFLLATGSRRDFEKDWLPSTEWRRRFVGGAKYAPENAAGLDGALEEAFTTSDSMVKEKKERHCSTALTDVRPYDSFHRTRTLWVSRGNHRRVFPVNLFMAGLKSGAARRHAGTVRSFVSSTGNSLLKHFFLICGPSQGFIYLLFGRKPEACKMTMSTFGSPPPGLN